MKRFEMSLNIEVTDENRETMELMLDMGLPPRGVQQRRTKGWRMPPATVSVARPHRYGNPFRVGSRYIVFHDLGWGTITTRDVGPLGSGEIASVVEIADREQAVTMYTAWMKSCLAAKSIDLSPLRGKNLACFCPLDEPCHRNVLLVLANQKEES